MPAIPAARTTYDALRADLFDEDPDTAQIASMQGVGCEVRIYLDWTGAGYIVAEPLHDSELTVAYFDTSSSTVANWTLAAGYAARLIAQNLRDNGAERARPGVPAGEEPPAVR